MPKLILPIIVARHSETHISSIDNTQLDTISLLWYRITPYISNIMHWLYCIQNYICQNDHVEIGACSAGRQNGFVTVMLMLVTLTVTANCASPGNSAESQAMREYQKGLVLQSKGNINLARQSYSKAIQLYPEHAESYVGLGYIHYIHENYREAMAYLTRAIQLDPDIAMAYNYRGMVYIAADEPEYAHLNFTKAIQIDPTLTEAYYKRSHLHYTDGNIQAAIDDMTSVIDLTPTSPKYLLERAQLYVLAGNTESAASDLEYLLSVTLEELWILPAKRLLSKLIEIHTP